MAITGAKPLPIELHLLNGTHRADRHGAIDSKPKPKPVAPQPPYGLLPLARKFWKEHAAKLERLGILTEIDGPAFGMMATHWALAFEAMKAIRTDGLVAPDENGALRKHPLLQVLRDNSAAFRSYAAEFGLTPSSRCRLTIAEPEGEDAFFLY